MSLQLSDELLDCARKRLSDKKARTESDLRRATSDLYFSLFHRVCGTLVEHLHPNPDNLPEVDAWRRLYRVPDHKFVEKQCRDARVQRYPHGIRLFANQLISLKTKREDADYDPLVQFEITQVRSDIDIVSSAHEQFDTCRANLRASFCVFVSIKGSR